MSVAKVVDKWYHWYNKTLLRRVYTSAYTSNIMYFGLDEWWDRHSEQYVKDYRLL